MRHSATCCTSMHGHRFEGGAAGERKGCSFRESAAAAVEMSTRVPVAGMP